MNSRALKSIVAESNTLEGITRAPTEAEIHATAVFLAISPRLITIADLERLAAVYAGPRALLREKIGMDVAVGVHRPPHGQPVIRRMLSALLIKLPTYCPFKLHREYENLHPFMDGNGRTGRALWWLRMQDDERAVARGFLRSWYYQSLENGA